ncbi:hypothetical protein ES288_A05G176600v1 [Gossypium darwinii]|uniref:Uncharacterized protein n=1 Tax=Gossypium darwinii TaxID=34276 RepID=A0A5D2GGJ6_GOSDA|nr:hypothetical protein ES288_A05G176600v1 [Gossypium darwinii]
MTSPFSLHQQQFVTTAKPNGGSQAFPVNSHQFNSNGLHFPALSSGSVGHQVPRMAMPVTGQHMQNRSNQRMHPAGSSVNFPISRFMHELVHTRAGSLTNHWHEKHWRSADLSIYNLFDDTNSMGKRLRFLIVNIRDVYKAVTHWQKSWICKSISSY